MTDHFSKTNKSRCSWVDLKDPIYVSYHDNEWGKPVHAEHALFETLVLETFVAGLSWQCILHKRADFRAAFDRFNPYKIALYTPEKCQELAQNKRIVRHIGKIKATVDNARAFLRIQKAFGSFDSYIWHWTNRQSILANPLETHNHLSDRISKNLKQYGMRYAGSVTVYSYLCAIGVLQAHQPTCFCQHDHLFFQN